MLSPTVREAARRFGERTALVSPTGWSVSYAALDRLADSTAAGLRERGIGEGDVVASVLPPCPEHVVLFAAAARLGAVTAGVNHRLTAAERDALLAVADPALVVTTAELAPSATGRPDRARPGRTPAVVVITPAASTGEALVDLQVPGATVGEPPRDPDRPVAVVFTSGTTGTPRGAVFASRQLEFITEVDTGGRWGDPATPATHALSGMSLTHLGPTTKLPGNLMKGGTTHLTWSWSPYRTLELTQRHRMAVLAGIPTQVALVLHHPRFTEFDLSSVRAVVMGGGPTTPALVQEATERLGVPVMVRYSCTEAGVGLGTAPSDLPEVAAHTVGRPHSGVELTIRAADGAMVAPGEVGEVCLRSPAVMSGYHRDPVATAAALCDDGAVRTGDLGRLDPDGRLVLVGRSKEMWVRGGYNVHPLEVEAVLAGAPGVRAVAVAPRADDLMGEVGVAVVVPDDPARAPTLQELRGAAAGRLARHKLPEDLLVVDHLPLTAMEKLDRRALAALVAGSDTRTGSDTGAGSDTGVS